MQRSNNKSYCFIILCYNHEKYIIEHLESIKFQVQKYGKDADISLIITDDASTDDSTYLIDHWLNRNKGLFYDIKKIYNINNIGTCNSVINALLQVSADACKITAGDDIYSYENILNHLELPEQTSMLFGRALYLYEDKLVKNKVATALETITDSIYKNKKPINRFMRLSYNNAPNLIYRLNYLRNKHVQDFLRKFDVVEDWPLQIKIALEFPNANVELVNKTFVYYRRTSGSTYLVANSRFKNDKLAIFDDLIDNAESKIAVFLLRQRRRQLELNSALVYRLFNLNNYLFVLDIFANFTKIIKNHYKYESSLHKHNEHLDLIKQNAKCFIEDLHYER